ncbi:MAG: S53 family peptidase [Solirubrobacterales bacterium]
MALALAATVVAIPASSGSAAPARARKALTGSTPSWATPGRLVGGASGKVRLAVALRWRHAGQLAAFDRSVSDPRSAGYGHYLSAGAFRARFSPSRTAVARVEAYLRGAGLRVDGASKSRMLVHASGSTNLVERAFATELRTYRYRGRKLRAPASGVSVPASLASTVTGVVGLDQTPMRHLTRAAPPPAAFVNARPCSHYWGRKFAPGSVQRAYHQTQPWAVCGYDPSQLQGAYKVDGAIGSGNDGSGQTVGIVDAFAAPTIVQDVNTYSRRHGLPPAQITQTKDPNPCQVGCSRADQQGWYGEETLDLEAVHTMAPGAGLAYYAGRDPSNAGLLDILSRAIDDDTASVITNSYGTIGQAESKPTINAQEQLAQQAIAQGISLMFSSGDGGDERAELGRISTDYPASSPLVTAVGGTSLGVGPLNNHLFEVGWGSASTTLKHGKWRPKPPGSFYYGSGGGTSRLFAEPDYQLSVVPNHLATRYGGRARVVPDISMDGDPNTGMLVGETQTFPNGKAKYGEYRIGGTSLSSPLFAGYTALANQAAGHRLGFLNPALYGLAANSAIRDIRPTRTPLANVVGYFNNGVDSSAGKTILLRTFDRDSSLRTKKGYDNVTGLGSPGSSLIQALAGP